MLKKEGGAVAPPIRISNYASAGVESMRTGPRWRKGLGTDLKIAGARVNFPAGGKKEGRGGRGGEVRLRGGRRAFKTFLSAPRLEKSKLRRQPLSGETSAVPGCRRKQGLREARRFGWVFAPSPFTFPRVWPAGQLTGNASKSIGETRPVPGSFFRSSRKSLVSTRAELSSIRYFWIFVEFRKFVRLLKISRWFACSSMDTRSNIFLLITFETMEVLGNGGFLSWIRATISCEHCEFEFGSGTVNETVNSHDGIHVWWG